MSFPSTSDGRASSQHNSHHLTSLRPQQPWYRDRQDIQRPNFGDTRSDLNGPRRSVTLPNSDSLLVSHPQVPVFPNQNYTHPSSHPFFTPAGSQQRDLGVPFAAQHLSDGALAHANFATDATAVHRPSHLPPSTWIAHPTMGSAGPSRFGGEQPAMHSWNDNTGPPGRWQMMAAPVAPPAPPPASSPLLFLADDPRALHPFPTAAPAGTAQAQGMSNANMIGWHRITGGENASTYIPSPTTGTRTRQPSPRRRLRQVPLVRVEDQVEWAREHVLKVTLWLNWSPNADADAHGPWN